MFTPVYRGKLAVHLLRRSDMGRIRASLEEALTNDTDQARVSHRRWFVERLLGLWQRQRFNERSGGLASEAQESTVLPLFNAGFSDREPIRRPSLHLDPDRVGAPADVPAVRQHAQA